MCGLSGVYGAIGVPERNAFGVLQMFAQLRGRDSTGVGLVYHNKKRKPDVLKSVGGQETLAIDYPTHFDQRAWTLKDTGLLCVIGHNRWATVGGVNEENAHPFHIKNIIGCHNGTIPTYDMRHLDKHRYGVTDSQIIMEELAEGKSINDTVEYLPGAWAFTWYDTKRRRLNMCRNKERTLFVTTSKNGKTLFTCSESWMLTVALARSGVSHGEIHSVVPNQHLVWKIKGNGDVKLDEVSEAQGGKVRAVKNFGGISKWWGGEKKEKKEKKPVPLPPSNHNQKWHHNVVPLHSEDYEEDYTQTFGQCHVSRRRFEALIKDGCANCTGDLTWEERDQVVWLDAESPACKDCAEHIAGKEEVGYRVH